MLCASHVHGEKHYPTKVIILAHEDSKYEHTLIRFMRVYEQVLFVILTAENSIADEKGFDKNCSRLPGAHLSLGSSFHHVII
jgi:hypothetical protein